jgi:hypothetical protein
MATQITTTEDAAKPPLKAPVRAGGSLAAFVPQSLEEAWRLSTAIAASGMAPKTYGTDPNKIMVGLLAGAEVGLTPFVALQSIANINGNPALWGDGMLGLVEASGLLEDFEESDDGKVATCRAVRKGRKTPIIRTFSTDDAKVAGLAGKTGPWQQYPKRMRQMRARSLTLRDGFSDVLKGIKSAEEVRDYAPMDGGMLGTGTATVTAAMIEHQASPDQPAPGTSPAAVAADPSLSVEQAATDNGYDAQTGEITTLASATGGIDAAETVIDVNNRLKALCPLLNDDDADALVIHAGKRIDALKGGR